MKKVLKTITLSAAFAIAMMSTMVPMSEASWYGYGHCSLGGQNCEIYEGGEPTTMRLDWLIIISE